MKEPRKVENLIKKLDAAADASQAHRDAISLAADAFFDLFGEPIPECCLDCANTSEGKVMSLFWEFVHEGEASGMSEAPYNVENSTGDLVHEMMRLMNENTQEGS